MSIAFKAFPKIPRLASPFTITEKLDGSNGTVVIVSVAEATERSLDGTLRLSERMQADIVATVPNGDDDTFLIFTQSRNRFITPQSDNFGFAAWVKENAEILVEKLGTGYHAGEWWGHGIQRGYGLPKGERRFSLFNVGRFRSRGNGGSFDPERHVDPSVPEIGLGTVPILAERFSDYNLRDIAGTMDRAIVNLMLEGSYAAPGFNRPEGVVLYHGRSGQLFKSFVDDAEKAGEVATRGDLVLAA